MLTNAGLTEMVKGVINDSPSTFTDANSSIALGSGTGAAVGNTALAATELARADATRVRSGLQVTFSATFTTGQANGTPITQWGVLNNRTSGGTLLSIKDEALGTKTAAQSWAVTATLTFSVGT